MARYMGLRGYIVKRIIYMLVLIWAVITVNFIIFFLMPGDPSASLIHPELPKEAQEEIIARFALNQSLSEKYVSYLVNLLRFNFGYSYRTLGPVANEIGIRIGNTILLIGVATSASIVIGVLLGVIVAYKRDSLFDSAMLTFALFTYSLPTFWMGLIILFLFGFTLHWFPIRGAWPEEWIRNFPQPFRFMPSHNPQNLIFTFEVNLSELYTLLYGRFIHIIMPLSVLILFYYGGYMLLTRATMLESLTEDFVVTARAKGLPERTVLYKHTLKNASLPLITSAALAFGGMLGGAIITEQVFTYAGLGHWIWQSILAMDYPSMQAIFYVIALCVIIANFIADLSYGVIDPRIRYG